jgi:hypothetical protein
MVKLQDNFQIYMTFLTLLTFFGCCDFQLEGRPASTMIAENSM